MKRWSKQTDKKEGSNIVDDFVRDILVVCKNHNLSISHEDGHGAFIIERYDPYLADWFNVAQIGRSLFIKE